MYSRRNGGDNRTANNPSSNVTTGVEDLDDRAPPPNHRSKGPVAQNYADVFNIDDMSSVASSTNSQNPYDVLLVNLAENSNDVNVEKGRQRGTLLNTFGSKKIYLAFKDKRKKKTSAANSDESEQDEDADQEQPRGTSCFRFCCAIILVLLCSILVGAVGVVLLMQNSAESRIGGSEAPTQSPIPTPEPTAQPTHSPVPTAEPTVEPTPGPTVEPTDTPSQNPTTAPVVTGTPTVTQTNSPTAFPTTRLPTKIPTTAPVVTGAPTVTQTNSPTSFPTTGLPTPLPTAAPTDFPTTFPTSSPTVNPTQVPTATITNPCKDAINSDWRFCLDEQTLVACVAVDGSDVLVPEEDTEFTDCRDKPNGRNFCRCPGGNLFDETYGCVVESNVEKRCNILK